MSSYVTTISVFCVLVHDYINTNSDPEQQNKLYIVFQQNARNNMIVDQISGI